ncbi:hypothetical protein LP420_24650 [Massilia sp. B-10]|nr:hypothetical protein LP420_24650 [Massilia sp. B-10]
MARAPNWLLAWSRPRSSPRGPAMWCSTTCLTWAARQPQQVQGCLSTQTLINAMVAAFNTQLKTGVAGETKILYVDLYATSHDQVINPAPYGLSNTSTPACATNILSGNSLVCNATNLITGDVSHFMFADDVLPTLHTKIR